MAVLDAHRWRRASPHLDRVLDLPVLDREASLAALRAQDPEVKAKLIENTQSAVERGAFGSPTFFVGNEMFFGKEQLREVEELISSG